MRLAAPMNERPASVRTSARLVRLNSLVCKCASSSDTLRLTVARGVFWRRAAADRLPVSATANAMDMASKRSTDASKFGRISLDFARYTAILEGPKSWGTGVDPSNNLAGRTDEHRGNQR